MNNSKLWLKIKPGLWSAGVGLFSLWWYIDPYPILGIVIAAASGLLTFFMITTGRIERFRRPLFTIIMLSGVISLLGTFFVMGPIQFNQWIGKWDPGYYFTSAAGQGVLIHPSPVVMGSILWGRAQFIKSVGMWQASVPGSMASSLLFMLPYGLVIIIFGRAFCGWLCPIGGLVDLSASTDRGWPILNSARERIALPEGHYYGGFKKWINWLRYGLLLALIILSFVGGFALINIFYPVLWLKSPVLFLIIMLVIMVLAVTLPLLTGRRWWCYICPAGTAISLIDRLSPFKLKIDKFRCVKCMDCSSACRMFALTPTDVIAGRANSSLCVRCGRCIEACSENAVDIFWAETPRKARTPFIAFAITTILAFNIWHIVLIFSIAGRLSNIV